MKPAILTGLIPGLTAVANEVLERADVEFVLMHDAMAPMFEAQELPYRLLSSYLCESDTELAEQEAARRIREVGRRLLDPKTRTLWPDYDDALWNKLLDALTVSLGRGFHDSILLIESIRACALQTDLRLILVPHDVPRPTKTAITYGHRLGVPTLHVIHGIPAGTPLATTLGGAIISDLIAVPNERCKAQYEGLGVPPERVIVTGNPQWDPHCRPPWAGTRQTAAMEFEGLDHTAPVILYALTFGHHLSRTGVETFGFAEATTDAVLRGFGELAQQHPDWQFVLRPHPNDPQTPRDLLERARTAGVDRAWVDERRLGSYAAVVLADVVVCVDSNIGVEAVLAGRPMVNVVLSAHTGDFFMEGLGPLFTEADGVMTVSREEDPVATVQHAMKLDVTERQFLNVRAELVEKYNFRGDGKGAERVARCVVDMIRTDLPAPPALDRFPEFETALAAMVPDGDGPVVCEGAAAGWTALAVAERYPARKVTVSESGASITEDAVHVWANPLPHGPAVDEILQYLRRRLPAGGVFVAGFESALMPEANCDRHEGRWVPPRPGYDAPSRAAAYSRAGVRDVLARNGYTPVKWGTLAGDGTIMCDAASGCDASYLLAWLVCATV